MIEPLRQPPTLHGFLIGAGVVVLLAAIGALHYWFVDRWRTREYARFCLERGFTFEHDRPEEVKRHLTGCPLFNEGHGRSWGYTISGTHAGAPFTAFEYEWETGQGRGRRSHVIGAMVWTLDRSLPEFMLTPEGFWDMLAVVFGGQDIDFEDAPTFSQAYRLRGADEAAVRGLFTPALRHTFAVDLGQHVGGGGHELLWWRPGRLPPPVGFDQFLMEGERIHRLFASE